MPCTCQLDIEMETSLGKVSVEKILSWVLRRVLARAPLSLTGSGRLRSKKTGVSVDRLMLYGTMAEPPRFKIPTNITLNNDFTTTLALAQASKVAPETDNSIFLTV